MANTLRFKRGLASGIPTALAGEPLFTTDTFDLYIGNGTTNTRFQKYIASGTTSQLLRGDGSLLTMPIVLTSPSNGQVLKFNGTSWVNDSDAGITGSGAAGQVAYFTGATTQAGSNNLFWDTTNLRLGVGLNNPSERLHVNGRILNQSGFILNRGDNLGVFTGASDDLGIYHDGTNSIISNSTGALIFSNPSERARIFATGNFGIGTGASDSGQKLQVVGTGYFSDSVGIGSTSLTITALRVSKNIEGGTTAYGVLVDSSIRSGVTAQALVFTSSPSLQNSAFTLTNLRHFYAIPSASFGSATVINQYGFYAETTLTGATNNYGFFGDIAAASGRWNLYMNGTANNYMAGRLGIGSTNLVFSNLRISNTITGGANSSSIFTDSVIQSDVTNSATGFYSGIGTAAASFTVPSVRHFIAEAGSFGAGSSVTTQVGFVASSNLTGATNNYGFQGGIPSGTNRWNLYMSGTALNYLNGNTLIGSTTDSGEKLQVTGTAKITGASTLGGVIITGNPAIPAGTGAALTEGYYAVGGYAFFQGYNYTTTSYIPVQVDGSFLYLNANSSGNVGIATSTNVPSAQLHISSTTKGFLPPRMTTSQKNAISSPAAGLIVYDTTLNKLCVFTTTWQTITSV